MTSLLSIGTAIRDARTNSQMSVVTLAEKSGVNRNTIANLEMGKANVELNTLISICHVLGLSIQLAPVIEVGIPKPQEMLNETPLSKMIRLRGELNKANFNTLGQQLAHLDLGKQIRANLQQKALRDSSATAELKDRLAALTHPISEQLQHHPLKQIQELKESMSHVSNSIDRATNVKKVKK